MNTRAKFSCKDIKSVGIASSDARTNYEIILEPVYSGSEENREFFEYTPSGQIRLGVVSPTPAGQFQVGHDYYVDFTDAEEVKHG